MINYSVENGLISQNISDLHIDGPGKLWITTDIGLMVYNGYAFQEIQNKAYPAEGLTGIVESDDVLLFFNSAGKIYALENNLLNRKSLFPDNLIQRLTSLAINAEQTVYIPQLSKIITYNLESKNTNTIDVSINENNAISDIISTRNDDIYFLIEDQGIFNLKDNQVEILTVEGQNIFKGAQQITLNYTRGKVLITLRKRTTTYLFQVKNSNVSELNFKVQSSSVVKVVLDHQENIWLLTNNGAQIYDSDFELLQSILPGRTITDMVQDVEGTYWISTLKDGLYKLPNLHTVIFNPENSGLHSDNVTRLALLQNDYILVGFNQGIVQRINKSTIFPNVYNSYDDSPLIALVAEPSANKFYTAQRSLHRFDLNEQKPVGKLFNNPVSDFSINKNGDFLLATNQSLISKNIGEQSTLPGTHILMQKQQQDITNGSDIRVLLPRLCYAVHFDQFNKGSFWVSTDEGFFYITPDSIQPVRHENKQFAAVKIKQHTDGKAWVLTKGKGLFVLERNQIIQHLNIESGLASDVITALAFDESIVWVGTNRGINILNIMGENLSFLTAEEGIIGTSVNDILVSENFIWLAINKGVIRINRDYQLNGSEMPTVQINRFLVDDKEINPGITDTSFFTNSKTYKFYLQPVSLNKKIKDLSYRLHGLEEEWNQLGNIASEINYPALPHGEYQLQVKVINKNDKSSTLVSGPQMMIVKTFRETNLFKLLIILLIIGLTGLIAFFIIRNIKRKQNLELDLYQSKLKAINLQMNPHFVYNVLNSVQDHVLSADPKGANKILGKFANILRQTLDLSNQDFISLETEINSVTEYVELENLKSDKNISLQIFRMGFSEENNLSIPPLIFQPVIENAIIHAYDTSQNSLHINLNLELSKHKLICKIQDNGIGLKDSFNLDHIKKSRRYGLNSIIERIDLFKRYFQKDFDFFIRNIEDESSGTLVQFELPIVE